MSVGLLTLESGTRKKVSASGKENISGNRYDLVLVCQPDFEENYRFYNRIVELVESEKRFRIFSPHKDYNASRRNSLEDSVNFTVSEAIPRTRGVLVHLSSLTQDIQRMWDSTVRNKKPFLVIYSKDVKPIRESDFDRIRQLEGFRGIFEYVTEMGAIEYLRHNIDCLLEGN